jgi:hypothetical protein
MSFERRYWTDDLTDADDYAKPGAPIAEPRPTSVAYTGRFSRTRNSADVVRIHPAKSNWNDTYATV